MKINLSKLYHALRREKKNERRNKTTLDSRVVKSIPDEVEERKEKKQK